MDLNQVTLTGTVERTPITRAADNGAVVGFTVRVVEINPSGQEFRVYIPCEAYGQAKAQAEALHAGDMVLITGKLKWTAWNDKKGEKRTSLAVLARMVKVVGAH